MAEKLDKVEEKKVETKEEEKKVETKAEPEKLVLTQEGLDKILQIETDKRVTQALKTAEQRWEKEYNEKLKDERREAERLAKLSDEERQKELDEKYKNELSIREKELNRKEMKLEAINILSEKKLPVKFADILIGETAEETQKKINDFQKAFRDEVEAEVNVRLKGVVPKGGTDVKGKKGYDMNAIIRGTARRR